MNRAAFYDGYLQGELLNRVAFTDGYLALTKSAARGAESVIRGITDAVEDTVSRPAFNSVRGKLGAAARKLKKSTAEAERVTGNKNNAVNYFNDKVETLKEKLHGAHGARMAAEERAAQLNAAMQEAGGRVAELEARLSKAADPSEIAVLRDALTQEAERHNALRESLDTLKNEAYGAGRSLGVQQGAAPYARDNKLLDWMARHPGASALAAGGTAAVPTAIIAGSAGKRSGYAKGYNEAA